MLKALVLTLMVAIGAGDVPAQAAAVTYVVTPTSITTAGGQCNGSNCVWKAYQGCNLSTQNVGAFIGNAQVGVALPGFSGDTASPPTVCIRAESVSGGLLGTFSNVTTLNVTTPPGSTTTTYTCQLNPATGGTCTAS